MDEEAIDKALNETYGGSPNYLDEEVDTSTFATAQGAVDWQLAHAYVRKRAAELRQAFAKQRNARIVYFGGYPEVPLALALGAYIGDEWQIDTFDLHERHGWIWPKQAKSLDLAVNGIPSDDQLDVGPAVILVELSASILESHVQQFVKSGNSLAILRITPVGKTSQYSDLVQSSADIGEVRRAVRFAMGSLFQARPNVSAIHAFVAAPSSVAFAVGQELRIRNSPPVQTYRHRNSFEGPTMSLALVIAQPAPRRVSFRGRFWHLASTWWRSVSKGKIAT